MPHKGFATITVRQEVHDKLETLKEKLGVASLNDVLERVLKEYMRHVEAGKLG